MLLGGVAIYTCMPSIALVQLGMHCLEWKVAITLAMICPTGQTMRCPKWKLIAKHTCRKIPCTVDVPSAALLATRGMDTPCMSLNNVTTTFFSTPIGSFQWCIVLV